MQSLWLSHHCLSVHFVVLTRDIGILSVLVPWHSRDRTNTPTNFSSQKSYYSFDLLGTPSFLFLGQKPLLWLPSFLLLLPISFCSLRLFPHPSLLLSSISPVINSQASLWACPLMHWAGDASAPGALCPLCCRVFQVSFFFPFLSHHRHGRCVP